MADKLKDAAHRLAFIAPMMPTLVDKPPSATIGRPR